MCSEGERKEREMKKKKEERSWNRSVHVGRRSKNEQHHPSFSFSIPRSLALGVQGTQSDVTRRYGGEQTVGVNDAHTESPPKCPPPKKNVPDPDRKWI